MPKNTSRYKGAAIARQSKKRRWRPRLELVVVGSLALAVFVGLGSLAGAYVLDRSNHDWTRVASVNGHDISREQLRGRMAVLGLLARERAAFAGEAMSPGDVTAYQVGSLQTAAASDTTLEAARQSLIDDELLRELAARDGVPTPAAADPWAEATTYASQDLAHRVRYVRFGPPAAGATGTATNAPTSASSSDAWPAASAANADATTTRVRTELSADTAIEKIVSALHDAGWQVFGEDVSVSAEGVPADSAAQLDPSIAAATIRGTDGAIVGPATDAYGLISIGKILDPMRTTPLSRRLPFDADKAKVDSAALQAWADGRAIRRAVTDHLIGGWSKSVTEAHFREIVVGEAPGSSASAGPWVELSQLSTDRLKDASPASVAGAPANLDLGAEALAKRLTSMSGADRAALFGSLVVAANAAPGADAAGTSGEIGFYAKDGLIPDLGKAAFADSVHSGDVIGPVSTSAGPSLFLIEARYSGALDDRAQVALRQIRLDTAPDPVAYARQFSPTDVALATDAGWRAEPEFGSTEAARTALFDTTIRALSDPFVLDGKLALAIVDERRTGIPDPRSLDRLTLDGYAAWYGSQYARAKIIRTDDPLPELMPSATPSASAAPQLTAPVLETPNLPAIPGQPAATPVQTDAFGLPALP